MGADAGKITAAVFAALFAMGLAYALMKQGNNTLSVGVVVVASFVALFSVFINLPKVFEGYSKKATHDQDQNQKVGRWK